MLGPARGVGGPVGCGVLRVGPGRRQLSPGSFACACVVTAADVGLLSAHPPSGDPTRGRAWGGPAGRQGPASLLLLRPSEGTTRETGDARQTSQRPPTPGAPCLRGRSVPGPGRGRFAPEKGTSPCEGGPAALRLFAALGLGGGGARLRQEFLLRSGLPSVLRTVSLNSNYLFPWGFDPTAFLVTVRSDPVFFHVNETKSFRKGPDVGAGSVSTVRWGSGPQAAARRCSGRRGTGPRSRAARCGGQVRAVTPWTLPAPRGGAATGSETRRETLAGGQRTRDRARPPRGGAEGRPAAQRTGSSCESRLPSRSVCSLCWLVVRIQRSAGLWG